MKKVKKFFNKIFRDEFIKKITLLSAFIGGGVQVLWILYISPAYLRFFSTSQMISDTVMIFTSFTLFFLPFKFIIYLAKFENDKIDNVVHYLVCLSIVGLFSLLISSPYGIYNILLNFLNPHDLSEWIGSIFIVVLIFILIFYLFYINFLHFKSILILINKNDFTKNIFITLPLLVLFLFGIKWFFTNINNTLIIPEHYMNINYICKRNINEVCKVRYFNDKYIFVEKDNKYIEILKFDAFFEKNSKN